MWRRTNRIRSIRMSHRLPLWRKQTIHCVFWSWTSSRTLRTWRRRPFSRRWLLDASRIEKVRPPGPHGPSTTKPTQWYLLHQRSSSHAHAEDHVVRQHTRTRAYQRHRVRAAGERDERKRALHLERLPPFDQDTQRRRHRVNQEDSSALRGKIASTLHPSGAKGGSSRQSQWKRSFRKHPWAHWRGERSLAIFAHAGQASLLEESLQSCHQKYNRSAHTSKASGTSDGCARPRLLCLPPHGAPAAGCTDPTRLYYAQPQHGQATHSFRHAQDPSGVAQQRTFPSA